MLKSIKGKVIPNKLEETCTWRKLWRTLWGGMPTFSIVSVPWSIYPLIIGRVKVRRGGRWQSVYLSAGCCCWCRPVPVSQHWDWGRAWKYKHCRPGPPLSSQPTQLAQDSFSKKISTRNLHSDRKEIFSIFELKWAIVLPEFYIFFHFDI